MFVEKGNNLYILKDSKRLVGVDFSLDKGVKEVSGSDSKLEPPYNLLTASEVKMKFNITLDEPYVFPKVEKVEQPKKDVKTNKTK